MRQIDPTVSHTPFDDCRWRHVLFLRDSLMRILMERHYCCIKPPQLDAAVLSGKLTLSYARQECRVPFGCRRQELVHRSLGEGGCRGSFGTENCE